MAICPSCKEQIPDSATGCPKCGKRVIPADELEKLPGKTTTWQKVVIAAGLIILIGIGFTFQGAEDRENRAAQENFSGPMAKIIQDIGAQTGISGKLGAPQWKLNAQTKSATVAIDFPKGELSLMQAMAYGQGVCGALARAYVDKGYTPRHLTVSVAAGGKVYGKAVFNGNLGDLNWETAK